MTPEEWNAKFRGILDATLNNRVLFFATTNTMASMQERIWGRGELSGGGTLTYNEDYEVYIYKPPFPRAPKGKGKTGKPIKGEWQPTYLAAKASQDREDLPFELTGDMRIAWARGPKPEPQEVNPRLCQIVMPDKEFRKAEGLAKQKGEFLALTDAEQREQVQNIIVAYRDLVLSKL